MSSPPAAPPPSLLGPGTSQGHCSLISSEWLLRPAQEARPTETAPRDRLAQSPGGLLLREAAGTCSQCLDKVATGRILQGTQQPLSPAESRLWLLPQQGTLQAQARVLVRVPGEALPAAGLRAGPRGPQSALRSSSPSGLLLLDVPPSLLSLLFLLLFLASSLSSSFLSLFLLLCFLHSWKLVCSLIQSTFHSVTHSLSLSIYSFIKMPSLSSLNQSIAGPVSSSAWRALGPVDPAVTVLGGHMRPQCSFRGSQTCCQLCVVFRGSPRHRRVRC